MELDTRLELIMPLIPIGIMAIYEELDREVERLAGRRWKVDEGLGSRCGTNRGTVRISW